jgi:dynein heavy chain, axonemal
MDAGVKLLDVYAAEFASLDSQRVELASAEKLFDIPLADYTDFYRAKQEFHWMESVYKLYRQQKIGRETWSETLWSDLKPDILIEGIDSYLKDYRKFDKEIRQLPIAQILEQKMKHFRNVIPLMANLKHEALRERHWQQLMTETGKSFDMNPKRFTLENMFAMELHKYQVITFTIILPFVYLFFASTTTIVVDVVVVGVRFLLVFL